MWGFSSSSFSGWTARSRGMCWLAYRERSHAHFPAALRGERYPEHRGRKHTQLAEDPTHTHRKGGDCWVSGFPDYLEDFGASEADGSARWWALSDHFCRGLGVLFAVEQDDALAL